MEQPCPVCAGDCALLDVVDFNKSCEEARGHYLPISGVFICYFLCSECGFCFAPEMYNWSLKDFEEKIYNNDYIKVDPDYVENRPRGNAEFLINLLGKNSANIKHLDYGGGAGLLSNLVSQAGWSSVSYDPFVDKNLNISSLGKFDLITAFEVFEHVPQVKELITNLSSLLVDDGVVLFSTLLSDNKIEARKRITWWYAAPRNGHISLFSQKSLQILWGQEGFYLGSFSEVFHGAWKKVPAWANHFIRVT